MNSPAMLIASVIASRTSAAYIRAPISTWSASAKWFASEAASVVPGEKRDQLLVLRKVMSAGWPQSSRKSRSGDGHYFPEKL
jgi:hypothetical protein